MPADPQILQRLVKTLCEDFFPRSTFRREVLGRAGEFINMTLNHLGYAVQHQHFPESQPAHKQFVNYWVDIAGKSSDTIVIGAHYDAVDSTPGADDNASAVAGLLEIARLLQKKTPALTLQLVFFANEEAPSFGTEHMGSFAFAQMLRRQKKPLMGMISLEMIGYFTDAPASQTLPLSLLKLIYPDQGNFICFASTFGNFSLVNHVRKKFRRSSSFPSETFLGPALVKGLLNSDHSSFIANGYKAMMITDTAYYRNLNYHTPADLPDTLNYEKMAAIVDGIVAMLEHW